MVTAVKTTKRKTAPKTNRKVVATTRKEIDVVRVPLIRAKFDAAQTNTDNTRHWANVDALSPDAAANPQVRKTLRNRSRYEIANNTYAKGMVKTIANDTVGTTPRLQLLTEDTVGNELVEDEFLVWANEIRLAQKLRTMRMALCGDGEAFGILTNNPNLRSPVKLDLKLVEADQVATPVGKLPTDLRRQHVDGIEFDRYGNRRGYWIRQHHPGGGNPAALGEDAKFYKAANVLHWYRADRPGQNRGVPEITPALPLFAQLRRYTLAVIAAAETAADFAAVLESIAPASGEPADLDPMDIIELEKRMATILPEGWKLGQVKAEQPTTTYAEFKKEILNEIARCLSLPYNVAAGNSAGYNYASGRLDHQVYYKMIRVDRFEMEQEILDPLMNAWISEAILVSDYLPLNWRTMTRCKHQWFFDGNEHVDPAKEANAQDTRLANFSTNYAIEYARQGRDWRREFEQIAVEKADMERLGLTPQDVKEGLKSRKTEFDDDDED